MANQPNLISAYTLAQATTPLNPRPIVAKRAPKTSDTGYIIGQLWIYSATNAAYILTSVANSSATWQLIEGSGSAGVFTTLTSSGNSTIGTGASTTNTFGAGASSSNAFGGGSGSTNSIGNVAGSTAVTLSAGTGGISIGTVATGTISIGGVGMTGTLTLGQSTAGQAINIGNASGANVITIGNATSGNITTLASPITALPGPVYIYTGAGAPSNGLALHVGDIYINTTAASATTRMYIATAASTWTNITCAA